MESAPIDDYKTLYRAEQAAFEAFARKYNFWHKRPQDFKNCMIFVFKSRDDRAKISEYVDFHLAAEKHFNLRQALSSEDQRFITAGIYITYHWDHKHWIIPNDFKDAQDWVSAHAPKWAKVRVK